MKKFSGFHKQGSSPNLLLCFYRGISRKIMLFSALVSNKDHRERPLIRIQQRLSAKQTGTQP
jgi:hypothetical protein